MKKLMVVLAMLSLVGVAQAVDNVWNIDWSIAGAYSPDDDTRGVLLDYSVTWSLILDATGETIASMSAPAGSSKISVYDPFTKETLSYKPTLKPSGDTAYFGSTQLTGAPGVYQYIVIDNGVDQYEWKSSVVEVPLSTSTMVAATPIDASALLGKSTPWTKVTTIPEPATMSLLGLGALAMVLRRRIRR